MAQSFQTFDQVASVRSGSRRSKSFGRPLAAEERFADDDLLAAHFDHVTRLQFAASANFGVTVHLDFAILNHELGVSTGAGDRSQLQKLIQTELGWFWRDVGFWQGG